MQPAPSQRCIKQANALTGARPRGGREGKSPFSRGSAERSTQAPVPGEATVRLWLLLRGRRALPAPPLPALARPLRLGALRGSAARRSAALAPGQPIPSGPRTGRGGAGPGSARARASRGRAALSAAAQHRVVAPVPDRPGPARGPPRPPTRLPPGTWFPPGGSCLRRAVPRLPRVSVLPANFIARDGGGLGWGGERGEKCVANNLSKSRSEIDTSC